MGTLLSTALQPFSRSFFSLENYKLPSDPDYTNAFNRCIAAMPVSEGWGSGGGIIMLDGKDYVISSTIVIQNSIAIIGAGSDSGTKISLAENSNCDMFQIGRRNSDVPISVTLSGMRIEMMGLQALGYSNLVFYNYIRHSHFMDLFVVGATAPNLIMKVDSGNLPGRNNYFYGCAFEKGIGSSVNIIHDYNLNINSCYFGFGVTGNNTIGLLVNMSAQRFILANSWFLQDSLNGNLHLSSVQYAHIVNNHFSGNLSGSVGGSAHMRITSCNQVNVGGNICLNSTYPYAIFGANNTNVKIYDNQLGYSLAPFWFDNKENYICNNNLFPDGKHQENTGVATIPDAATFVDVTHNIHTTPDSINTTPQANEHVWVSNIGATTFRINRTGSTGNLICGWRGSVKTY